MFDTARRMVTMAVAVIALSAGSPASAHEDHDAIGAGPGPAANVTENRSAGVASAADDHMAMGSMTNAGRSESGHGEGMAMSGMHDEASNKNKTFGQRLASWLGRLHPMVIHFPIGMFIGAFAVELFGLWRRNRDMQHVAHVMLVVGALGAIVAAFLGWFAGGFYFSDRNPILMTHRWLGTAIAGIGLVLVYLAASHRRVPERSRTVYLTLLGLMTLAISVQGFLGGTFMHGGLQHLAF